MAWDALFLCCATIPEFNLAKLLTHTDSVENVQRSWFTFLQQAKSGKYPFKSDKDGVNVTLVDIRNDGDVDPTLHMLAFHANNGDTVKGSYTDKVVDMLTPLQKQLKTAQSEGSERLTLMQQQIKQGICKCDGQMCCLEHAVEWVAGKLELNGYVKQICERYTICEKLGSGGFPKIWSAIGHVYVICQLLAGKRQLFLNNELMKSFFSSFDKNKVANARQLTQASLQAVQAGASAALDSRLLKN